MKCDRASHETLACERVLELLGEFFDLELSEEQSDAVGRHLEGCGECSAYLADYRAAIAAARDAYRDAAARTELPPALVRRIGARLRAIARTSGGNDN